MALRTRRSLNVFPLQSAILVPRTAASIAKAIVSAVLAAVSATRSRRTSWSKPSTSFKLSYRARWARVRRAIGYAPCSGWLTCFANATIRAR